MNISNILSGHAKIVFIALGFYSLRLLGYSIIGETVSLCILLEVFKPFCTTLLLISAMTFVKDVSPLTTAATIEGIFGAAYFGAGRSLGGFAGGFLTESLGFVQTFQIFALISLLSGLIYISTAALDTRLKSRHYALSDETNDTLYNANTVYYIKHNSDSYVTNQ